MHTYIILLLKALHFTHFSEIVLFKMSRLAVFTDEPPNCSSEAIIPVYYQFCSFLSFNLMNFLVICVFMCFNEKLSSKHMQTISNQENIAIVCVLKSYPVCIKNLKKPTD